MEYRVNRRTGDRISVIGLGSGSIPASSQEEGVETLRLALEKGINHFDLATAEFSYFETFALAFPGEMRRQVKVQLHFGAMYGPGKSYGWSLNLDKVRRSVEWQLGQLKTDYIDYGFIHCLDEEKDWQKYRKNGILAYLLDLRDKGVVRHIGLSSHNPKVAQKVLDTGLLDMLLFSINPGYDFQHGDYAKGSANERMDLYRRCETMGVGIAVMKPFAGGQLLDPARSPFGQALTPAQCLQYALDKPGVLTVLPGVRDRADLLSVLRLLEAPAEERDYSVISSLTPKDMEGRCVYCHHCQPCPAGLDVGLVNKYYDLALAGDTLARDHYARLDVRAAACTQCGHCSDRCPFHVDQMARMREIAAYFGS